MKRLLSAIASIVILVSILSCELFIAKPAPPELHTLLISLDYEQHSIPKTGGGSFGPLPGAIQDIKEVAVAIKTLMSGEYFAMDGSITLMIEEYGVTKPDHLVPTRANIQTQLASYAVGGTQEMGENDILLLYYTGHGGELNQPMVVADSKTSSFVDYITVEDLNSWTGGIKGKVVLILDSCFSGQTIGEYPRTAEEREDIAYNPHMFNLTAASASQESWEENFPSIGHRHGYFSRYFLEAIGWNHISDEHTVVEFHDSITFSVPGQMRPSSEIPSMNGGMITLTEVYREVIRSFTFTENWISLQTPQTKNGPLDLILFNERW